MAEHPWFGFIPLALLIAGMITAAILAIVSVKFRVPVRRQAPLSNFGSMWQAIRDGGIARFAVICLTVNLGLLLMMLMIEPAPSRASHPVLDVFFAFAMGMLLPASIVMLMYVMREMFGKERPAAKS